MKLISALLVFLSLAVPSRALDREAFTFTSYNLDIRIEPEQRRLGARGTVTLRNDSASAQHILALQISSTLEWRSIQLDGKPVQFVSQPYTSDIDHTGALSEALVSLPREIASKSTVELEVGYEGIIPLNATRLTRIGVPAELAVHSDWDQVGKSFSAVRGIGYVVWYPVATEAANLSQGNSLFETLARWKRREAQARMKITLKHSGQGTPPTLLCNGEAGGEKMYEQIGRSYQVGTECSFEAAAEAGPLFVIGNYVGMDRPPVNISYLQDHKPAAESYAIAAKAVLPFVTEWFGAPQKPEARAEFVELADSEAAAYESGKMLLTPLTGDSKMRQFAAVHQLTHAAFVSPRPWIFEGLAHFVQAVYREREDGRDEALTFLGHHRIALAEAEKAAAEGRQHNGGAEDSLIDTGVEEFNRSKAMYVWWMLRDMIGEIVLKKAIAAYHADADQSPAYVQQLIEAQTQRDLGWFFKEWVYRDRGLPDFKIVAASSRKMAGNNYAGNNYMVSVTVENHGDAGAEVPLILKMEMGQVSKRIEIRAKSESTIRIEAVAPPTEIVVNDGSVPESDTSNNVFKVESPSQ